jgi:hypothetical protein
LKFWIRLAWCTAAKHCTQCRFKRLGAAILHRAITFFSLGMTRCSMSRMY